MRCIGYIGPDVRKITSGNHPQLGEAGGIYQFLRDLHTECGPVAEFCEGTTRVVSAPTPIAFKPQVELCNKPAIQMEFLAQVFGSKSIRFINGEEGKQRRQKYDAFLSNVWLDEYFYVFLENATGIVEKWCSKRPGESFSVHTDLYHIACKSAGMTMFGDYFKNDQNVDGFMDLYWKFWPTIEINLTDGIPPEGSKERHEFDTVVKKVHDICNRLKKERGTTTGRRLVDAMLETGLDGTTISGDMLVYMLTGFHSTGLVLIWCLYFAAKHQDIQQRIFSEVDAVLGDEELKRDMLPHLKFLRQFVNETLRIRFVTPIAGREAEDDMDIYGFHMPQKTQLVQALSATMMDETLWPEPERFDPDRFRTKETGDRHQLSFCPFGFEGKRTCPGQNFFYMEATIILACLFRKFQVFPENDVDTGITYGFLTRPRGEVFVKLQKR
ncbi:hypothetical protein ScPMuIL_003189 [Solemya velum]